MEENVKKQVIEQVHALITAPSVTPQLKQVAQDWLSAVDTEGEDLQTRSLIAELSADVNTIDEVIPFFASAFAKQHSAFWRRTSGCHVCTGSEGKGRWRYVLLLSGLYSRRCHLAFNRSSHRRLWPGLKRSLR